MRTLLIIVTFFIACGAQAQTTSKVDEYAYDHAIRWAIRGKAADPMGVKFSWSPPTYERIAPPIYERKYEIKISGQTAYGYAKVKYNGGDAKDLKNWTILKSTIDR